MHKLLLWLEARLGAWVLRALKASICWEVHNRNPESEPCIYFFWHRDLVCLAMHRIGTRIAVMVSKSKDGELLAGPLERLNFGLARGSSSKGATQALKEMIRLSKTYQLGITPDGPRGPAESIQPGVFEIALLAKIPVIAAAAKVKSEWRLNSWDRLRIPKPFTRIEVHYSEPFYLTKKDDFPLVEQEIRSFIEEKEGVK